MDHILYKTIIGYIQIQTQASENEIVPFVQLHDDSIRVSLQNVPGGGGRVSRYLEDNINVLTEWIYITDNSIAYHDQVGTNHTTRYFTKRPESSEEDDEDNNVENPEQSIALTMLAIRDQQPRVYVYDRLVLDINIPIATPGQVTKTMMTFKVLFIRRTSGSVCDLSAFILCMDWCRVCVRTSIRNATNQSNVRNTKGKYMFVYIKKVIPGFNSARGTDHHRYYPISNIVDRANMYLSRGSPDVKDCLRLNVITFMAELNKRWPTDPSGGDGWTRIDDGTMCRHLPFPTNIPVCKLRN